MQIEIGWGSLETIFRPGDARYRATIQFRWVERGGSGASPSGISYLWHLEPTGARQLAARLIQHAEEYEAWVEAEKARYATERAAEL